MLTLPGVIDTHISNTTRHPKIGFELQFSVLIRIANSQVVWDNKTFIKAGVNATNFKTGKGGIQTGRIEFINDQFVYTSLMFAESNSAIKVLGYLWWGDGPFDVGDEIPFFKGEIVKPVKVHDTIVLDLATVAVQARQIPEFTPGPPDINYLPYPNQIYNWEGENYQVVY